MGLLGSEDDVVRPVKFLNWQKYFLNNPLTAGKAHQFNLKQLCAVLETWSKPVWVNLNQICLCLKHKLEKGENMPLGKKSETVFDIFVICLICVYLEQKKFPFINFSNIQKNLV